MQVKQTNIIVGLVILLGLAVGYFIIYEMDRWQFGLSIGTVTALVFGSFVYLLNRIKALEANLCALALTVETVEPTPVVHDPAAPTS